LCGGWAWQVLVMSLGQQCRDAPTADYVFLKARP
jgi:hypothetical protein